jgi:carboxymethylenebutenolidase
MLTRSPSRSSPCSAAPTRLIPPADIGAFEAVLGANEVPHEIHVYPEAPHSFFDRAYTEFADASADAWERLLEYLGKIGTPSPA